MPENPRRTERTDAKARPVRILRTHVSGLDEKLGGGIPQGHVVLISGSPGTMKSSLAYSILHHNARAKGVRGIYISLEQSRRSLLFQMGRLGLNGPDGLLEITDLARIRKGGAQDIGQAGSDPLAIPWLDIIKKHISYLASDGKFQLVVLDSLPVLDVLSRSPERRNQLFFFFEWLRDSDLTSFIISEVGPESRELHDEEFLADGIIYLSLEKVSSGHDIQRRVRCVKMRGMPHSTSVFNLEFRAGSFLITPPI